LKLETYLHQRPISRARGGGGGGGGGGKIKKGRAGPGERGKKYLAVDRRRDGLAGRRHRLERVALADEVVVLAQAHAGPRGLGVGAAAEEEGEDEAEHEQHVREVVALLLLRRGVIL